MENQLNEEEIIRNTRKESADIVQKFYEEACSMKSKMARCGEHDSSNERCCYLRALRDAVPVLVYAIMDGDLDKWVKKDRQ